MKNKSAVAGAEASGKNGALEFERNKSDDKDRGRKLATDYIEAKSREHGSLVGSIHGLPRDLVIDILGGGDSFEDVEGILRPLTSPRVRYEFLLLVVEQIRLECHERYEAHVERIERIHKPAAVETKPLPANMEFLTSYGNFRLNDPVAEKALHFRQFLISACHAMEIFRDYCFGDFPNYTFMELMQDLQKRPAYEALKFAQALRAHLGPHRYLPNDWQGVHISFVLYKDRKHGLSDRFSTWASLEWDQLDKWIKRRVDKLPSLLEAELKASSENGEVVDDSRPDGTASTSLLEWTGEGIDLTYVMDCLKEAGLISIDTTDEQILSHFDNNSRATDKLGLYRQNRRKNGYGKQPPHPKVAKFIELLKSGGPPRKEI